jgi:hypothetical protein
MVIRANKGDIVGARQAFKEAKQRDPSMIPGDLHAEIESMRHERWYLQMESLYGEQLKRSMDIMAAN